MKDLGLPGGVSHLFCHEHRYRRTLRLAIHLKTGRLGCSYWLTLRIIQRAGGEPEAALRRLRSHVRCRPKSVCVRQVFTQDIPVRENVTLGCSCTSVLLCSVPDGIMLITSLLWPLQGFPLLFFFRPCFQDICPCVTEFLLLRQVPRFPCRQTHGNAGPTLDTMLKTAKRRCAVRARRTHVRSMP